MKNSLCNAAFEIYLIGLWNDNLRSPVPEQNANKFSTYKDFKEKPGIGLKCV